MASSNTRHHSADAAHYDQEAKHYDAFNEVQSKTINKTLTTLLKEHDTKTVLDLTCGTGSQVFWLTENGFEVVGVDINDNMLNIAKDKAQQKSLTLQLQKGDMRSSKTGTFDAVITIFNAIGHLTIEDFELALDNINDNLKMGGLYIFDIFNTEYLLHEDNITKLTIDNQKQNGDITAREIQYSTINQHGVLASYDIYHEQTEGSEPNISTAFQTLQVYTAQQLEELLTQHGFEVIEQCNIDRSTFDRLNSERILTVARKNVDI